MSSKTQALYEKGDWVGKQLSDLRFNAVLPLIRGRLLDLGCGDNRLVRAHGNGTGVDVEDFGADLTLTNFDSLPFEDSSFDTVAIIASINYFLDPRSCFVKVLAYFGLTVDSWSRWRMPDFYEYGILFANRGRLKVDIHSRL